MEAGAGVQVTGTAEARPRSCGARIRAADKAVVAFMAEERARDGKAVAIIVRMDVFKRELEMRKGSLHDALDLKTASLRGKLHEEDVRLSLCVLR